MSDIARVKVIVMISPNIFSEEFVLVDEILSTFNVYALFFKWPP